MVKSFKEFHKMKEDATAASTVPTNSMGASSSTASTGGIDTYDPLFKIRKMIKRKKP